MCVRRDAYVGVFFRRLLESGRNTRMTVDINPSVELMVDKDNKVISVTALNDDAAVILQGEASIVGKESDDAVKAIVSLATDTGYIVKGEVSADENTVKISVSGDTKWAKDLAKDAEQKVNQFFKDSGIAGTVEKVDALTSDALKALVEKNSTYTKEEIAEMNDEQVLKVIALGRVETAQLLSNDMREAYFEAKTHEISIAKSDATWKVIQQMNAGYAMLYAGYGAAIQAYGTAIQSLDDMRYSLLVDPESSYQKLLTQMREKKMEIIKKKVEVTISVGDAKVTAEADLSALEKAYDALYTQLENAGKQANDSLTSLISAMTKGQQALQAQYDKLPSDITSALSDKAQELEDDLNKTKDAYFDAFEKAHADDIKAMNDALEQTKKDLIASISAS